MKKWALGFAVLISGLSFISAARGLSFGFGNIFSSFNISMYLTALLFATIFGVIYLILGRTPLGENTAVRWLVALCASSFAIWGVITSGFSLEEFLFRLGITSDLLPTFLWMIAIIIAIIIIVKAGFRNFFAVVFGLLGALLIILSLFGEVYYSGAGIAIGAGLILLALLVRKRKPKIKNYQEKWYKKLLKKKDKNQVGANNSIEYGAPAKIQQKRRSIYDLKQKYIAYGNRFNQVARSNPNEARRILQAMDVIVRMARRQGVREGEFLSNRYVMNYKSVKEIRRKSGY